MFVCVCVFQVVIDDLGNKEVYQFPVDAWFDIAEGDGKIQRDVAVGAMQPMGMYVNDSERERDQERDRERDHSTL